MRFGLLLTLLATACSSESSSAPSDASVNDADGSTPSGGCEPRCHWDCFGGPPFCADGAVWTAARGPRSCCRSSDPWPGPGPRCASEALGACREGCAATPDSRYASCTGTTSGSWVILCAEGRAKSPGAPCSADSDCRPAADAVTALRCDTATSTCVGVERSPTPTWYGAACAPTEEPPLNSELVFVNDDAMAPWPVCYVARTDACTKRFLTMSCTFDEDCPPGSICVCTESTPGAPVMHPSFCLPKNDRTKAGRMAAPRCASASDAGADG